MKVLITGGAGFIGSHLTDALLEQGHQVTIIDDLSTGRMENFAHVRALPNFHFAIETIMNETVMDRLVSECDVIYHLASAVGVELIVSSPVEVIERCVLGSEMVLKIANRYKRKVLITSTSEVYGKSTKVPFSEEDDRLLGPTTKSRWSYSCSKAIDEFLALAYFKEKGLPVVLVRLFNTVGPRQTGQYGMVVPRFIKQAMEGRALTVYGAGSQSRCFGFVGDVVGALIKLMNHPQAVGQIFNIGNTQEVTIMELAKRVLALTGSASKIKLVPYEEAYEQGFEDMARRVPDLTKIKKLIGYEPKVDLEGIITRIQEYELAAVKTEKKPAHELAHLPR
ncbi:MAG: GDP-mannose 4,6-dehydratase [candidate division KSB1 bacterium]